MFGKMLLLCCLFLTTQSFAQDNLRDIEISIYNNNLALIKDTRKTKLQQGNNEVAFEGVATQIKPESVMIIGRDINVLEQNYDYDLITKENIIQKSVGKTVKTVTQNPTTGENIFNKAKIVSASGTKPVLEFDYGIEPDFNGRLVFEKLPQNLREKPTLIAKINSNKETTQELELAYLTNSVSWKTNYVAHIKDQNLLNLTAWVTINNNSGTDYDNAKIDLIAGEVNQIFESPLRTNRIMMTKALGASIDNDTVAESGIEPQNLSSYQLYSLPNRTDIKNNQTKQMSLFEKFDVKYQKQGRLSSRLYFNSGNEASFEKIHPDMYYIMNNNEEANLNLSLPTGAIRFYENDAQNNMQFIGENTIANTAKGEKIELRLGQMFNVFVSGKIVDVKEVSETKNKLVANGCYNADIIRDYTAEIEFVNSSDISSEVVFTQNIGQDHQVLKENIKGNLKNINLYEWKINLKPNATAKLDYMVRVKSKERVCD
ncbi:MAG: DUF4139 domain-containing protein [Alphaproteobacteria bacterium]|nr:DUF4139 domain-containing protein [Alphaproteobacteria bacterium]